MNQKDALFVAVITLVTLFLCLVAIRSLAPGLLGVPGDLQMVRTSSEVPAFYDGVFASGEVSANDWMLLDPITRVRPRPFIGFGDGIGPHDLLGFRNNAIPAIAEIVVLGDSQTYGNNAILERNWPSHLGRTLGLPEQAIYSMASGGWGAIQYLDAFDKALAFSPRVIVVAFYTGNDPLDSFLMAYNYDDWSEWRPDPSIDAGDAPPVLLRADETWSAELGDLGTLQLTPSYRLASNDEHPAVRAGYEIMARVAERMSETVASLDDGGTDLAFTIIPTKELVYSEAVARAGLTSPSDYRELIRRETENIAFLRERIAALDNASYIDVVGALTAAATTDRDLYPANINGHPKSAGYAVIGRTIAEGIGSVVGGRHKGLGAIPTMEGRMRVYYFGDRVAVLFPSPDLLTANGWTLETLPFVDRSALTGLEVIVADQVDPERFGPQAVLRD